MTVHLTLPFLAADTLARLKAAGYPSQNSELYLCYVCDKPFSSLVHPSCFDRLSKCLLAINIQLSYSDCRFCNA